MTFNAKALIQEGVERYRSTQSDGNFTLPSKTGGFSPSPALGSLTLKPSNALLASNVGNVEKTKQVQAGTSDNGVAQKVLDAAHKLAGQRIYAGSSEMCAASVRAVYRAAGIPIGVASPATDGLPTGPNLASSFSGKNIGQIIPKGTSGDPFANLKPGDLLIFNNTYGNFAPGTITHVGIYEGKDAKGQPIMMDHNQRNGFHRRVIPGSLQGQFSQGVRPYSYTKPTGQ